MGLGRVGELGFQERCELGFRDLEFGVFFREMGEVGLLHAPKMLLRNLKILDGVPFVVLEKLFEGLHRLGESERRFDIADVSLALLLPARLVDIRNRDPEIEVHLFAGPFQELFKALDRDGLF